MLVTLRSPVGVCLVKIEMTRYLASPFIVRSEIFAADTEGD